MVISNIYKEMCDIMSQNPNSDANFEANQLIEFVLGKKRIELLQTDISNEDYEKLISLSKKRLEGYPLQYIIGKWYFFDMELSVGEGVLIPRQDTETVCEAAFEQINKMVAPTVLDLCSGSGCIALAIKKYCPHSSVVAIEKSEQAYKYLVENIENTGIKILPMQADILRFDDNVEEESFDVIISNPPYIDPVVKQDLQTEVSYEPEMALFANDKGLYFYRFIAKYYRKALKDKGFLIFEYGFDQQKQVKDILTGEGYKVIKEIIDLGGNPRGIVVQKI